MSILIKGMEMPKELTTILFHVNPEDGTVEIIPSLRYHEKYGDEKQKLPIIPVPPNGRLIDADALKNIVLEALNDAITDGNSTPLGRALCAFIAKNIVDEIDAAPTIIPADQADKEGE